MKKIVVAVQKGGAGKTMLVSHLGAAIERAGDGPAAIIDTDPQKTLATWWNLRQAETPKFINIKTDKEPGKPPPPPIEDQVRAVEGLGFKYCLFDTPPALTKENFQIIKLADLVIVPTRPSPNDLWTLPATLKLIKDAGVPFVFVITQANSRTRATIQTATALSAHGRVLSSIIQYRVGYADSMSDGRTAPEVYPNGPHAEEVAELWVNIKNHMGELANVREFAKNTEGEHAHA